MKMDMFKILFIISLIGIFLLLFLSMILEPRLTSIAEINNNLIDKKIKIQGTVLDIKTYEDSSFQIISIEDNTGKIDITSDKILNLTDNQRITVIGTVNEYKQYLQVPADKIFLE